MIDVVVTDYGPVRLSPQSVLWLDSSAPEWRERFTKMRGSDKHARFVHEQVRRLEQAVMVTAEIWHKAGKELREF